ncbi:MAG: hypothetical protein ACI9G5_003066, partial [Paracoccaceae bacterium]
DPCLDIVGNRLPNVFLDRVAEDMGAILVSLQYLAAEASEKAWRFILKAHVFRRKSVSVLFARWRQAKIVMPCSAPSA